MWKPTNATVIQSTSQRLARAEVEDDARACAEISQELRRAGNKAAVVSAANHTGVMDTPVRKQHSADHYGLDIVEVYMFPHTG